MAFSFISIFYSQMRLNKHANLYLAIGTRQYSAVKSVLMSDIKTHTKAGRRTVRLAVLQIGQICKLGGVFCRTPMSHASATNGLPDMKTPYKTHRVIDPLMAKRRRG
jgi:hypothetical protein